MLVTLALLARRVALEAILFIGSKLVGDDGTVDTSFGLGSTLALKTGNKVVMVIEAS